MVGGEIILVFPRDELIVKDNILHTGVEEIGNDAYICRYN